jgi:hypothetical protein
MVLIDERVAVDGVRAEMLMFKVPVESEQLLPFDDSQSCGALRSAIWMFREYSSFASPSRETREAEEFYFERHGHYEYQAGMGEYRECEECRRDQERMMKIYLEGIEDDAPDGDEHQTIGTHWDQGHLVRFRRTTILPPHQPQGVVNVNP